MMQPKTMLAATALAISISQPAAALPSHPVEMARVFADCAGRMTAMAQHAGEDGSSPHAVSGVPATQRAELFTLMLEAVEPDARFLGLRPDELLQRRLSAKAAQWILLNMADAGVHSASARAARSVASRIEACDRLILGG